MVNKKLEKYYWILGVVGITLIALFVFIYFLMAPLVKGIGASGKDLKANKQNLTFLKDKLDKLRVLKDKESELKSQERVVNGAIPAQKDVGGLFVQIEGMIAASQGSTMGIKEADAGSGTSSSTAPSDSSSPGSGSAPVQQQNSAGGISLSSADYSYDVTFPSYANFKSFLGISENAHRFIYLNNFKVDTSKTDSGFKVSLNYKAYYRQPAQTGGSK